MGIRYYFNDMLAARRAVNQCWNLGYWGYSFLSGVPSGAVVGIEVSPLAEGLIESRYSDYLV